MRPARNDLSHAAGRPPAVDPQARRDLPERSATDPTFASRFECKYRIAASTVEAVRRFIQPFVRPDSFATCRPGLRYPVGSLYLDSQDLRLYHQTVAGEKQRFKLRVRTYSDDPGSRAFFEVKQKANNVVHKRRAGLTREQAAAVLDQRPLDFLDDLAPGRRDDLQFFNHHAGLVSARPVIRVRYMREAYEAIGREPARVTLDSELMHAVTLGGNLSHADGAWVATPLDGVILEIKFTERFPWWIQELVRAFGLRQQSVPKYVLSLDHVLETGRRSGLSLAGLTLPPAGA